MSRKGLFSRPRSVVASWFISHLYILLVPLLVGMFLFAQYEALFEEQIQRSNVALLTQVQESIDGHLSTVKRLRNQIAFNQRLQPFFSHEGPLDNTQQYAITQILVDFRTYSLFSSFSEDFYIVFNNGNFALSSTSFYALDELYKVYHTGEGMTYATWRALMRQQYTGEFIQIPRLRLDGAYETATALVHSLPILYTGEQPSTLVVFIDDAKLKGIIDTMVWSDAAVGYILDSNDDILLSTGGEMPPVSLPYDAMRDSYGIVHQPDHAEPYTLSYIASKESDWKYVFLTPSSIYMEKLSYIRNLMIAGCAIYMLVGGVVAYLLTLRNYKPFRRLMQSLSVHEPTPHETRINEYRQIHSTVANAYSENQSITSKLRDQQRALCGNFLLKLLRGRAYYAAEDIEQNLASFDIAFKSDRFAVLLFYVGGFELLLGDYAGDEDEAFRLVPYVVDNVVQKYAHGRCRAYVTVADEMLACLVNFAGHASDADSQTLRTIAVETQGLLSREFEVELTATISGIHTGLANIAVCYKEALETMEYKMLTGDQGTMEYSAIENLESVFRFPFDTEYKLINAMRAGDYGVAGDILDKVFDVNLKTHKPSLQFINCLMFNVVGVLLKGLGEIQADGGEEYMQMLLPAVFFEKCQTIEEMRRYLQSVLEGICIVAAGQHKGKNVELRDALEAHIEANCGDVSLSVNQLAERFHMNPTYLSRFFKEQTGTGLLEHINKTRIKHAKPLLTGGDDSIRAISTRCGFESSNTFIRTFKKYEGITPGEYRKIYG